MEIPFVDDEGYEYKIFIYSYRIIIHKAASKPPKMEPAGIWASIDFETSAIHDNKIMWDEIWMYPKGLKFRSEVKEFCNKLWKMKIWI